eukprot:CAMPEP_0195132006 /NCGR_PEP_ID=MMETSP0448-20130528/146098_1 /TAXON_ID=66468 /ORGANISM="Heterocapsa triquestra, Strain CCMP 448" /LENGTH=55 /DNA_ID=CAMNT_0040169989 /DNA_START=56 /DNA_END=220 /DNA_ORIENTATION=-
MARRTARALLAAWLASPAVGQLCSSAGTAFPNPTCPSLPQTACLVSPGCLWNGTS